MSELRPRYIEDVEIGEPLPPLDIEITLTALVMYAGATWDFHRYHYDGAFVAQLGMPAPFMDGQMLGALLSRQLMRWGGPDAFLRRLSYRQRTMIYAGDRLSIRGHVTGTSIKDGRHLVHCTLTASGPEGRMVARDATADLEISSRSH